MIETTDSEKIAKLETKVTVLTVLAVAALLMSVSAMFSLVHVRSAKDGPKDLDWSRLKAELPGRLAEERGEEFVPPPSKGPLESIESSNAIVLAEHEKRGNELQAVIREILWVSPEAEFRYELGDDIGHPIEIEPNTRHGDSLVIFFEGKPARFKRSCSVYGDRILSFDEMKVSEFRKMLEEALAERK